MGLLLYSSLPQAGASPLNDGSTAFDKRSLMLTLQWAKQKKGETAVPVLCEYYMQHHRRSRKHEAQCGLCIGVGQIAHPLLLELVLDQLLCGSLEVLEQLLQQTAVYHSQEPHRLRGKRTVHQPRALINNQGLRQYTANQPAERAAGCPAALLGPNCPASHAVPAPAEVAACLSACALPQSD